MGIVSPPEILGDYHSRLKFLLKTYSERGKKLRDIACPQIMGRSVDTLKGYCRLFQIAFPDYVPMSMRPPKPPKEPKRKKVVA